MKITHIVSFLYPAWSYGGPGKLVYDLIKEFTEKKHNITLVSTDAFSQNRRRVLKDNSEFLSQNSKFIFYKNLSNSLAFNYKIFIPPFSFINIGEHIKESDVVHIHEFFTPLAILAANYCIKNSIPYFISAHGTLDPRHIKHRGNIKSVFMRLWGNTVIQKASGFIAATSDEIEEYSLLGVEKKRIHLIPNGVDFKEFSTHTASLNFRNQQGIASHTKIILFLGRINKLKGLKSLIDVFKLVHKKIPNSCLVIAGSDDGYMSELKNLISIHKLDPFVIFPGTTYGQLKNALYYESNVFVYPSPAEGFSIAILEAAASGLPIVITPGCKFPDVVTYEAGYIADDVTDMAEKVSKILLSKNLGSKLGKNAQKLIKSKYSIEAMSSMLIKLYNSV